MNKLSTTVLVASVLVLVTFGSYTQAKPKFNSQRVNREPGWSGPSILRGSAKDSNQNIPILERDYRPMHVYGNMTRRHHYRGTVIPSHRDRVEMLQAVVSKEAVPHKYVKNRYR